MAKVKICGLKRIEDIEYVNVLLPDFAGFVFAKSKRSVTLEQAKYLIASLDKRIKAVGVFVDESIERVKCAAEHAGLDIIQLHGSEDIEYIKGLVGYRIWKTIGIDAEKNYTEDDLINKVNEFSNAEILLDSSIKGTVGGLGVSFDWSIAEKISKHRDIVLAGGLNPDNAALAVQKVKPYAVDVSSGVETDGVKDFNKIKTFIKKVRKVK